MGYMWIREVLDQHRLIFTLDRIVVFSLDIITITHTLADVFGIKSNRHKIKAYSWIIFTNFHHEINFVNISLILTDIYGIKLIRLSNIIILDI